MNLPLPTFYRGATDGVLLPLSLWFTDGVDVVVDFAVDLHTGGRT